MTTSSNDRDRGAVLPLVLVLILVGALVVVPLLTYTVAVVRANEVEADKTRNVAAAKGAIRSALTKPGLLFGDTSAASDGCPSNAADLLPPGGVVVSGFPVSISCQTIGELSANEVFGQEVPVGAAQLQIAPDPDRFADFSGILASSGEAPPYPTGFTPADWAWWPAFTWTNPLDPSDTRTVDIPDLPTFTDVARSGTPFEMPGFDCNVFLPGRYSNPLTLPVTGATSDNYYFASGVYYFEEPVVINGDVTVVVGQGFADFGVGNDCADDNQVGANADVPTGTLYAIDGSTGGATWVFGERGSLDVNETQGLPTVRFNQRYAPPDRGQWVNIMSVNGDWSFDNADATDDDDNDDPAGDHTATNVSWVPRSQVVTVIPAPDPDDPPTYGSEPIDSSPVDYTPSHPDFTDEARVPEAPANVAGTPWDDGASSGSVLITFSGVEAEDTNGAVVTDYEAIVDTDDTPPAPTDTLDPTTTCSVTSASVVPTQEGADGVDHWSRPHPENAADPDGYACRLDGLTPGQPYWVTVRARNDAGPGGWATPVEIAAADWTTAGPSGPPDAPAVVEVHPVDGDGPGADRFIVDIQPPTNTNGAPIIGYEVEAYVVTEVTNPGPPVTVTEEEEPTPRASCSTSFATPSDREWTPAPTQCVLSGVGILLPDPDPNRTTLGYRVKVKAVTALGESLVQTHEPPFTSIDDLVLSDPVAHPPLTEPVYDPAERVWFPYEPTPIVSIDASDVPAGGAIVEIPGMIAVPMGTIHVNNPFGDEVGLTGGLIAGRIDIEADSRPTLPYGYVPTLIMQRELQVTATAGNVTSTAIVRVNSDLNFGVSSWTTQ